MPRNYRAAPYTLENQNDTQDAGLDSLVMAVRRSTKFQMLLHNCLDPSLVVADSLPPTTCFQNFDPDAMEPLPADALYYPEFNRFCRDFGVAPELGLIAEYQFITKCRTDEQWAQQMEQRSRDYLGLRRKQNYSWAINM